MKRKIGVLGSGTVGQVLSSAFLQEGYDVMIGTRDTSKDQIVKWKENNPGGKAGTFEETAAFGDLLVVATHGTVVLAVIEMAGKENFTNKTVIDCTNPLATEAPVKGLLKLFTTNDHSLMEMIQEKIPAAKVVKAFNSVGSGAMYKPTYKEGKPTMFICGNDGGAKKEVTEILTAFGWETEDMGDVESARAIEPLCVLWCIPGFLNNQWTHAFKLLKK